MRLTHYDEHKKRWQINDDYGAVMIDELNYAVGEAIDKLAAYEDAEEQGRLVILPCKVGDTLFVPSQGTILSGTVDKISVSERDVYVFSKNDSADWVFTPVDFGKTVFLTIAEAEVALTQGGVKT